MVVPTRLAWLSWHWTERLSNDFGARTDVIETDSYIGLPLLAIVAWFGVTMRRRPAARALLAALAVGVLAELGTTLHIGGARHGWLPWRLLAHVPILDNILPSRLTMFIALGVAIATAWWASMPRVPRAARIALPLAAVATFVPHLGLSIWSEHPVRPAFFTSGTYRVCLQPNESVLMLPSPRWGDSLIWQAEAAFRFRMVGGYAGPAPPENIPDRLYIQNHLENNLPDTWQPLIAWAKQEGATAIIVDATRSGPWPVLLAPVTKPAELGGVYLYSLRPGGRSACTQGSGAA